MLIQEKLHAQVDFTPTDVALAQVILADPQAAVEQTMQALADRAHCSHSAVIRLCKRLGFTGYREFTMALTREISVPSARPEDANFPFDAGDTLRTAADKLTELSLSAITSAKQELDMQQLVKAVQLLIHARRIVLYGRGDSSLLVQEFANKLSKIDIYPLLANQFGETGWNTTNVTSADCVLMVSYRGQNYTDARVLAHLRGQRVPIILITGRPEGRLAQMSDVVLEVPGDEFDFMKISTIASGLACEYLLTLLFAGIYRHDYTRYLRELKAKQATLTTGLLAEDGLGAQPR